MNLVFTARVRQGRFISTRRHIPGPRPAFPHKATARSAEPSEEIVRSRTWKPSSADSPTHECCILLIVTACGDHEREAVGKIEGSANSNIRTYSNFNLLQNTVRHSGHRASLTQHNSYECTRPSFRFMKAVLGMPDRSRRPTPCLPHCISSIP